MLEMLFARIKVGFLLILFFAPVCVAAWGKYWDTWLHQSHTLEAPRMTNAAGR